MGANLILPSMFRFSRRATLFTGAPLTELRGREKRSFRPRGNAFARHIEHETRDPSTREKTRARKFRGLGWFVERNRRNYFPRRIPFARAPLEKVARRWVIMIIITVRSRNIKLTQSIRIHQVIFFRAPPNDVPIRREFFRVVTRWHNLMGRFLFSPCVRFGQIAKTIFDLTAFNRVHWNYYLLRLEQLLSSFARCYRGTRIELFKCAAFYRHFEVGIFWGWYCFLLEIFLLILGCVEIGTWELLFIINIELAESHPTLCSNLYVILWNRIIIAFYCMSFARNWCLQLFRDLMSVNSNFPCPPE